MKKTRIFGLNIEQMKKEMMATAVTAQTNLLIEYAKTEIQKLGEKISSYNSKNHMDDTGNLLDSLCWGVCYDGEVKDYGFFREKRASQPSLLHGWSNVAVIEGSPRRKWKDLYNADKNKARELQSYNWSYMHAGEEVNGFDRAVEYIQKASKNCKSGQWTVFFAILAPYWGYWEEGFEMVLNRTKGLSRHIQGLMVMTQFYDVVKSDLKPAKVRIHVHVPKYRSKSLYAQAKKNLRNNR